MASDNDDLLLRAAVGKQVEWFTESDVGKYLLQCADIEINEGIKELISVAADKTEDIRAAQNRVWRGESFKKWIVDAVSSGKASEQLLDERND